MGWCQKLQELFPIDFAIINDLKLAKSPKTRKCKFSDTLLTIRVLKKNRKSRKTLCVVAAVAWQGPFLFQKTPHPPLDLFLKYKNFKTLFESFWNTDNTLYLSVMLSRLPARGLLPPQKTTPLCLVFFWGCLEPPHTHNVSPSIV